MKRVLRLLDISDTSDVTWFSEVTRKDHPVVVNCPVFKDLTFYPCPANIEAPIIHSTIVRSEEGRYANHLVIGVSNELILQRLKSRLFLSYYLHSGTCPDRVFVQYSKSDFIILFCPRCDKCYTIYPWTESVSVCCV